MRPVLSKQHCGPDRRVYSIAMDCKQHSVEGPLQDVLDRLDHYLLALTRPRTKVGAGEYEWAPNVSPRLKANYPLLLEMMHRETGAIHTGKATRTPNSLMSSL